jgi:hypothetical protein
MRRISRDGWLLAGLSVVLILLTVLAVVSQTEAFKEPPLSAASGQPDGGLALRLWLEQLDYQVLAEPQSQFQIPAQAAVALMLEPTARVSERELKEIEEWVHQGGLLILAGLTTTTGAVAEHFGFDLSFDPAPSAGLASQSPVLQSPPQQDELQASFPAGVGSQENDFLVLFARDGLPVIVSSEIGDGRLVISATAFPFSNQGLQDTGNGQLALNVISASGRNGSVWFDEWHHGLRATSPAISGPLDWLRKTAAGRALLYSALVIFIALALGGRSFGRPLALSERRARRPPIEYITAVANLSRRAGHRQAVLADYRYRLKRGLGYRYRLDPRLSDTEFVQRLAQVDAAVDTEALFGLLSRLNNPQPGEAQLVQLAREASHWIKES